MPSALVRYINDVKSRAREQIEKLIEKKQEENRDLEVRIRENLGFISGLQESLRLLPKESEPNAPARVLRPGSEVAKAREAILKAGRALHIDEILAALGKPVERNARSSLASSISAYVRNGEIFTRPQANTFGLLELAPPVNDDEGIDGGGERSGE